MYEQAAPAGPISWWQFSLKSLLITVTAVCVVFGLIAVPPLLAVVCVGIYVGLTGMLMIAICRGRGWVQAFSIGAMLPHVIGYAIAFASRGPSQLAVIAIALMLASCISGVAAAAWHGTLARRGGVLPVPHLPLIRRWFSNEDTAGSPAAAGFAKGR